MPAASPRSGITLAAAPAFTIPHTRLTPERGSSRRDSMAGSSVVTLARAKVRSPVRCGREVWPPVPSRRTSRRSAALVSESEAQPDLPHVDSRVTVQREDPLHLLERTQADQVQGPAGHDLLGGLEEQPDATGQQAAGVDLAEGLRGADERRGVDVVAAGVGDPRDGAGPRVGGGVLDRQRVEVGPQRDHRTVVAEIGDQAGLREPGDREARLLDGGGRQLAGPGLGPGQLGVGVQVTAQLDQLVVVGGDDRVDDGGGGVQRVVGGHRDRG